MSNWGMFGGISYDAVGVNSNNLTSFTTGSSTKGSYASLGTTSVDWDWFILIVQGGNNGRYQIDLQGDTGDGTGYQDIITNLFYSYPDLTTNPNRSYFPIKIPAGTALQIRGASSAGATGCLAMVMGLTGDFLSPSLYGTKAVALNTFGSALVPNPSTTLDVTTWVEVTSSTPDRIVGIAPMIDWGGDTARTSGQATIDIGIGSAGAETLLMPSYPFKNNGPAPNNNNSLFIPCMVSTGSRLVFRAERSGTTMNDTLNCCLLGLVG